MREQIQQAIVVAWKALVSTAVAAAVAALAGWGIELDPGTTAALELAVGGLGIGVINVALNWLVDQLSKLSWLAPVLRVVWPNPSYPKVEAA